MKGKFVRLGDISRQVRGVTYAKNEASAVEKEGYLPILRAGNITPEGLEYEGLMYVPASRISSIQHVRKGDVVIAASSGSRDVVGKAAAAVEDFSGGFGAFCKVLRPSKDVDQRYFGHFFRTAAYRRRVSSLAAGANINNLRNEHLDDLLIPLPPVPEQRRIAEVLDRADALRAKRRDALVLLDQLSRATYDKMFTRDQHQLSTLGQLLKSARVFTDGDWVESKDQDPNGDVRLTQLADIGDGQFLNKSRRFITAKKSHQLRCTLLEEEDVLVARMPDPLGRACLFPSGDLPCVTVVDVCVIRTDREVHDPVWLMHALNSGAVRSQISRFATGTTRSRISRGNLAKIVIPHVSIGKQLEFRRRAMEINASTHRAFAAATHVDVLFAALQQRAFAGKLWT